MPDGPHPEPSAATFPSRLQLVHSTVPSSVHPGATTCLMLAVTCSGRVTLVVASVVNPGTGTGGIAGTTLGPRLKLPPTSRPTAERKPTPTEVPGSGCQITPAVAPTPQSSASRARVPAS